MVNRSSRRLVPTRLTSIKSHTDHILPAISNVFLLIFSLCSPAPTPFSFGSTQPAATSAPFSFGTAAPAASTTSFQLGQSAQTTSFGGFGQASAAPAFNISSNQPTLSFGTPATTSTAPSFGFGGFTANTGTG